MSMQEFYTTYNLNKYNFAELTGVGTRSLDKFTEGKPIREGTRKRIECAVRVVEEYDLKRPKYDRSQGINDEFCLYKCAFHKEMNEYEERFRQLFNKALV